MRRLVIAAPMQPVSWLARLAVPLGFAMAVLAAVPASAHAAVEIPIAADLFPVDDWVGDGLKEAKDVVFGGL